MKFIPIVIILAAVALVGCGSDEPKLSPAQEQAAKDVFHKKPDINSLSPQWQAFVKAKMAESQQGKAPSSAPTK